MSNLKILLFSLENIDNVGEELLRVNTEFLLHSISPEYIIKQSQFKPEVFDKKSYRLLFKLGHYIKRVSHYLDGNFSYRVRNLSYIVKYSRYFSKQIKNCDKVITSVGMYKYSTQDFSYIYNLIAKKCQKYNKPLYICAPSIEDYNPKDWRSIQLVKTANISSVKMITTRDGVSGIQTLKNSYKINNRFLVGSVADPALWIPECFELKKGQSSASVPYIGINIIRKGIFNDYNKSFSDEGLLNIYVELIKELEKRRWKWAVYSNGMPQDIAMIDELHSLLKFSNSHILNKTHNAKEFVELISGFDAVFGARLHSCITSVSLGVPVVGFIWDNKIKYFAEAMKIRQFFFEPKDMTASNIIQALEQAMKYKYDINNIAFYKNKTRESLRLFLEESF